MGQQWFNSSRDTDGKIPVPADAPVNAFMSVLSFINYEWPLSQEPQTITKYVESQNKIRWQNVVCMCVCVWGWWWVLGGVWGGGWVGWGGGGSLTATE